MSLDLDAIRQRAEEHRAAYHAPYSPVAVEVLRRTEPRNSDVLALLAEVERLRATVERVEALADEAEARTAASPNVFTGAPWTSIARLRAALAGPAEQGGE